MSLKEILDMDLKYLLVGGKGGVGKTSVASSLAIALAEHGKKVLIISTDPAHSISDSFDMDFSKGEITRVKGVVGDLFALEINPSAAGEEISQAIGQPMGADQFSQFAAIPGLGELQQGLGEDLKSIPPPGMDEALSFAKILEYAEDDVYDTIVLDTAPTGHTLRLLNIPEFLDSFLGRILKMKTFLSNAMSMMKSLFGGGQEKDRTIETLEAMKEKVLVARDKLMDETKTQFVKVLIPTMMSVFETERLAEELDQHLIPHKYTIINMVNPENSNCPYCMHRHQEHQKNIEYIQSTFPLDQLTTIEAFDREIRGLDMLKILNSKLLKE